ncbi:MAG TPA: branched-chain amino acid ABC transporter substrate-binding protein [Burkholderiales bacterium]|nr:branched-chain amino acid ABC transporter substrate-binding protein [Burkholderiales bacterium]
MKHSALYASLLSALVITACGKSEPPAPPKPAESATPAPAPAPAVEVVKIGHVAPLTGSIAHLGKDNENGAVLAIDDANAKGIEIGGKKVKFELVPEDDQADPKVGTVVAQKLVDAKVAGVIGHLNSGTTIPASKLYSDANIPQISGSATNPKYTQQGFKTAFRVMANDIQQGGVLGNFIAKDLKAKNVAIIDDRTAYGQGLADEVEKAAKAAGAKIVAREFTTDKATDFKAILTNIKGKKPDVIFHGGMDATGAPMLKQMRELGLKAQLLQGDGGCTPEFIKIAGEAANGFKCSQAGLPVDKMPNAKDFKERFEKRFGQIQIYSPYTYDATMVLISAMQKANSTDPAKYLPELAKISHDGVTAKVEFDEKGDIKAGYITLYEVKGGKLEVLSTHSSGGEAPAAAATPAATPAAAPAGK